MNEKDFVEIDLMKLGKAVLKKIWAVILSAILLGGTALSITIFFVEPKYEASAMMYVNNLGDSAQSEANISQGALTAAQSLVDTYLAILNSRTTMEEIVKSSGVKKSPGEVKSMIAAESVNDTELFKITVTSTDPAEAQKIANAVVKVLPKKIGDIVDGSSVKVADYAALPSSPSSPNYQKNTLLGALAGILISVLIIAVSEMYNVIIKDVSYLTDNFDIPVLASIPNVNNSNRFNSYSYRTIGYANAAGGKEKK